MANLKCSECNGNVIEIKKNNSTIYKCEKCGATKTIEESTTIVDMSKTASLQVIMD